MKLIVGLGNPGRKYQDTRHNVGFMFVDELAKNLKLKFTQNKALKSAVASFVWGEEKIIVIKPQTYMNLSGEAVRLVADYYRINHDDILVIYDDLDLPEGKIRIRRSGSSGGHKGMASIINLLGREDIKRIRIGIGDHEDLDTADYVLSRPSAEGRALIKTAITQAYEMFLFYLEHSFDEFMGQYN
ncbi:MAG: aminoacyl-tRNA hydrolase [Acholeplasmataceae bacterium]|nr:aminoacyl-tRNA hydrolase [Acholeplasmataceae bacterium]